jgi:glutathione synthase/RimK-type ligase-like ATP-grasp enzyme
VGWVHGVCFFPREMDGPLPIFVILSPKDDHDKPWITNLQRELESRGQTVQLMDASNLKWEMNKVISYCIINRVRDSAPSPLGKNVGSFLRFAEAKGCTVINGSHPYAIGNSKGFPPTFHLFSNLLK